VGTPFLSLGERSYFLCLPDRESSKESAPRAKTPVLPHRFLPGRPEPVHRRATFVRPFFVRRQRKGKKKTPRATFSAPHAPSPPGCVASPCVVSVFERNKYTQTIEQFARSSGSRPSTALRTTQTSGTVFLPGDSEPRRMGRGSRCWSAPLREGWVHGRDTVGGPPMHEKNPPRSFLAGDFDSSVFRTFTGGQSRRPSRSSSPEER
jgi:hypothetical protein